MTTKRAQYLMANIAFHRELLRLLARAEKAGLSKVTIDGGLDKAFEGRQALAFEWELLQGLLDDELDKLRTLPPEGSA